MTLEAVLSDQTSYYSGSSSEVSDLVNKAANILSESINKDEEQLSFNIKTPLKDQMTDILPTIMSALFYSTLGNQVVFLAILSF